MNQEEADQDVADEVSEQVDTLVISSRVLLESSTATRYLVLGELSRTFCTILWHVQNGRHKSQFNSIGRKSATCKQTDIMNTAMALPLHCIIQRLLTLDRPHGTHCRHHYATVNYHPRSGINEKPNCLPEHIFISSFVTVSKH